ncbi:HD domain-containing protein, partial [Micromonospora musae]|uniref:NACHT domain-containing protein n=1 Tax=Micromonospora musae TaxID=1894970 RepID=UPI003F4CB0A5
MVLVDGLDEIMDPRKRQEVLATISTWRGTNDGTHRFVIATRPAADLQEALPEGWNPLQFELLPFDEEQRRQFSEGWFTRLEVDRPAEAAAQFAEELRRLGLGELARNPLMATMLCQLFVANPERRLPAERARIFEDFVSLLRDSRYSDADGGLRPQLQRTLNRYGQHAEDAGERLLAEGDTLIGRLAADMLAGDAQPAVDKLEQWTHGLRPATVPAAIWRDLLADYLRRSGVMLARGDKFTFLHQTIQEYLAAQVVAQDEDRRDAVFWDLFQRTVSGRAVAPPAWRQSFARFLVVAWPKPDAMASALRSMAADGGLNAALFIAALVDDGCELDARVIGIAVRTLSSAVNDPRRPIDDRILAVNTTLRVDQRAGLDLARDVVIDTRFDHGLRLAAMRTLANLAPQPEDIDGEAPDGDTFSDSLVGAGGDQWIMQQLTRLEEVDGHALLVAVAKDSVFAPRQRIWAADALARAGNKHGRDLLADLAQDAGLDSAERRAAATALHNLKDPRAAWLLRRLALDESERGSERQLAARTLVEAPHRGWSPRRLVQQLGLSKVLQVAPEVSEVLEPLIAWHRENHPRADVRVLQQAFDTAEWWHSGQFRKSGDPYITHPLAVATILANLGMDTSTLVAALLSGTVGDTAYSLDELRADYGDEVAGLVDGISRLDEAPMDDRDAQAVRKVVVVIAKDPRVLIIKLAQRLHNMRTLTFVTRSEQERVARNTLQIWAPLAHRMGINAVRWELEDLAFGTLFPKRFEEINRLIGEHQPQREAL